MPGSSYYIADSDPAWPRLAQEEMANIAGALGIESWRLEHVGSTAVMGLAAKPIIDLMLGVSGSPKSDTNQKLLEPLRRIGYEHKDTETIPGTLYIRKAEPRRFNLHMTEHGGSFWVDHLVFRGYLRTHPETARQYETLKRELIARFGHLSSGPNRLFYTDGKDEFIAWVLEKAQARS